MANFVYYVFIIIVQLCICIDTQDIVPPQITQRTEQHPASDFSRHTLIKPRIYHGREKRQISTTKDEGLYHHEHITLNLPIDGQDYTVDLTLNKQLIPKGFFRKTQQSDGTHTITRPSRDEVELCHYSGKIRDKIDSWAALSTCDGVSGVIFDGEEMHYIEKDSSSDAHFHYKHSDLVESNKTCGFPDPESHHHHHTHDTNNNRILRYKRAAEQNERVRGPYNANKESKYVELVLVVDNREYKELGESLHKVEQHCKSIANIINGLYAPLNIFIALVGVVIWTEHDEISFSPNGDTTLTNFLHYRREKLVKEHPNDNAQLLTKFNFENGVVGKALKGPICTYEYSGGVNTDHSPVVGLVATTVAHEMGHNFGMEHDTNECKCPEDRCIMAPSSSTVAPTHWSSCSLNYLLLAFTHGMDYCLKNKPEALFDSPVCGNGFVEPGEQCDCGLPEHCDNSCCNASTCMLFSNASCATGECCDLTTCKPKNAGTLCRSADYECDLPEYCTGQSEYCPADIYKMDTEVCDNGKAFCYHGFCRTRTDQCKLLWGETGKSSDEQCYKMNVKGNRHGNCGYNKFNQSFFKCNDEHVLCGMLHCKHLNERLEFGMESVSILSHSFLNLKGSVVPCRTAIVDLGINQVDPGLAPDGAKCGEGKMCVNQKCMSVSSLQLQNPNCPHDCNNNGWCNNLGHCHCKQGFAPPYCENPGPGGSEDSGPASDPNAQKGFVAALFIIFLGILPLVLLIAFLTFYVRNNVLKIGAKKPSPPTSKSPTKSRSIPFSADQSRREDNHSLLHDDNHHHSNTVGGLSDEFFGKFEGFSLSPKKPEPEPIRSAPPPPPLANTKSNNFLNKSVSRAQSFKQNIAGAISNIHNSSSAPALPPPNPGSHAKPIISSPILENSTCTAKELISPLRNAPKVPIRSAPEVPSVITNATNEISTPTAAIVDDNSKKKESNTTLNRITSFLKQVERKNSNCNSLPRTQVKVNKILDKNALKSIEISNPILQSDKSIAINAVPIDDDNNKAKSNVVMRAQSMRGSSVTPRPNIQTFGSMRQPHGAKRPMSIPSANRPKSPPPPAPPDDQRIKLPNLPGYQKPSTNNKAQNQYDDCLNKSAPLANIKEISPTSSDNIYAVIEESPVVSPESVKTSSGSNESMGLLGEIVSEIQNRNFDSIYSTSTLARKKKEQEEKNKQKIEEDENYVNTSSIYKTPPENVYSNMNNVKSSASSTSSGYINPSSVNPPINIKNKLEDKNKTPILSTFKSEKPFTSTFQRPQGPLASSFSNNNKTSTVPSSPTNNKTKSPTSNKKTPPKTINRQITPPNLRTRKSSPVRAAPATPPTNNNTNRSRPVSSNSPDLVTSCNTSKTNKNPDVLNVKKPSVASNKPNLLPKAPANNGAKSVSFKKAPINSSNKVTKANVARSNSNVATLQKKFENKMSNGGSVSKA